jgi:hypothetical protein
MSKGLFTDMKVLGYDGLTHSRFGNAKCDSGDHPGRWLYMNEKPCAVPLCTGDRYSTANSADGVSPCHVLSFAPRNTTGPLLRSCDMVFRQKSYPSREWMWVPYTCYYHMYSKHDLYTCANETGVNWIHVMGDSQEREFVSMLKKANGTLGIATKFFQVRNVAFEVANVHSQTLQSGLFSV